MRTTSEPDIVVVQRLLCNITFSKGSVFHVPGVWDFFPTETTVVFSLTELMFLSPNREWCSYIYVVWLIGVRSFTPHPSHHQLRREFGFVQPCAINAQRSHLSFIGGCLYLLCFCDFQRHFHITVPQERGSGLFLGRISEIQLFLFLFLLRDKTYVSYSCLASVAMWKVGS